MSQYNILQAIYMSFYSKKLYRDVAANWGGKSFLYLLMLLALSSLFWSYMIEGFTKVAYQSFSAKIIPQIPVMTLTDGKLSTPEKRPYFIEDPNTHSKFAIIDTTGQYTSLEQAKTPLLVTETQIIAQTKPNETKIYTISDKINQTIDPQVIKSFIDPYVGFFWLIIFPIILIVLYIYRILQALLYSILGKIFSAIFKVGLAYGQIVQIMLVAITPAIIISDIQHAFNITIRHEMLIYFLLGILYLFYGILANKNNTTTV